jgi:DNA uptake protein ComE-like DNA-binding protein
MARPGKKSAYSADDWLLEPARRWSKDPEPEAVPEDAGTGEGGSSEPQTGGDPAGPEISQWLVDSNGGRNGSSTEAVDDTAAESVDSEAESVDSPELTQVRDRLERTEGDAAKPASDSQVKLKRVEQAIAERIARFEDTLAEQQLRIADLEELLERRETELAEAVRERDEAVNERGSAAEVRPPERNEKREAALKERLAKRYEKREAELKASFDKRQAEYEEQLEELEEQLDIREAEVREQARERERGLMSRIEELESALKEAQQRAIAKPARRLGSLKKGGKLDLNETTFEQLRDLGLSVTLSARTISYRDARGGFESMDELDEIPGLSAEFKRVLKDQLKVG